MGISGKEDGLAVDDFKMEATPVPAASTWLAAVDVGEGTQSELVRAHGLRRARYRGLAKARLQNNLIGAAGNIKRWIRREAWKLRPAMGAEAGQRASATAE